VTRTTLATALILVMALVVRLYGIGFGLPGLYDPDELMFELGAVRMLSHASLDPAWFGHPATVTMYGLALVDIAVYLVGHGLGWFADAHAFSNAIYINPGWVILPGRWLMALFGTALVWQTMRLARMLYDDHAGLVAGGVVAVSPLVVGWSQVIRTDVMGAYFVMLCLCCTLRAARVGGWRADGVAAFWLGTAIATKWPMALAGLGMAGLMVRAVLLGALSPAPAALRLGRFSGMSLIALVLVSPYLVIDHAILVHNLHGEVQLHHLGATGGSAWWNLHWYGGQILHHGLGLAGFVLVLAGCLGMARRWRRDEAAWLIGPVLIAMITIYANQHLVWSRWVVPLVPLLAVPGGMAVAALARSAGTRFGALARSGVLAGGLAAICVPLVIEDFARATARLNDTRQRASAFAIAHIPAGSRVLIEHFGFDLYPQPWQILFPMGKLGCVDARALLHGKVDNAAIDAARDGKSNIDYGTMPRAQAPTCHADYAVLTQYDRYAAERSDFPQEYQAYRDLLVGSQQMAVFAPAPGISFGPVSRVVRLR
jgi:hypothetical protein